MSAIKYVSGPDGGGDYICPAGSKNCQTIINTALDWANNTSETRTVYLKGPYTYLISDNITAGSNTILKGDSTAIIKVASTAPQFVGYQGFVILKSTSVKNLEIAGFEIDGSCGERPASYANSSSKSHHDCERAVCLIGSSSKTLTTLSIHDLNIHDAFSDGIHVHWGTSKIKIYNNTITNCQHSSIFCVEVTGSSNEIYNNKIRGITSDDIRLDNCQNVKIHDNDIAPYLDTKNLNGATRQGEHGLQIANEGVSFGSGTDYPDRINNIEVYNNTFTDCGLDGICLLDTRGKGASLSQVVNIHHNTFKHCGVNHWGGYQGGISFHKWGNGVTITYNNFDGCVLNAINMLYASGTNAYTLDIKNNNITNTSGNGIYRSTTVKSYVSPIIKGNYFSGNSSNVNPTSLPHTDSSSYIPSAGAGNYNPGEGDPGDGTPDNPVNPTPDPGNPDTPVPGTPGNSGIIAPYIPYSSSVPTPWFFNYYIEGHSAYVNGVAINHQGFEYKVGHSLSDEHPPGNDGDNIGDFGEQSAEYTVHCYETSLEDAWAAVAAWKGRTPTIFEPGGPYEGWFLQGKLAPRSGEVQFTPDSNWYSKISYDVDFICDRAMFFSRDQHVRARKVYEDQQTWNTDDCYTGNLLQNGNFESWTPAPYDANWTVLNTPVGNDWECIDYSPELGLFCAVASSGTDDRVIIWDGVNDWRLPTGLTCSNRNNNWKTNVWNPDLGLWCAFSSSGLAGYACMTSPDTDNWSAVATPSGADSNAWSCSVHIPADSVLGGLVVCFASSGTNRVMYTADCITFTMVASADETASWRSAAFSPDLNRIMAVAYSGQVMYSDDFARTWVISTAPSQKWTSVEWLDLQGVWAVCSEDGEKQIMTSATGLSGQWVLQETPYSQATRNDSGDIISTTINTTPQGDLFVSTATDYTQNGSMVYSETLPALTNTHIYRINQVFGKLKSFIEGKTVKFRVTVQSASINSGNEYTIKEWKTSSRNFVDNSLDVSIDSATNEEVTIRFYLKTSNPVYRAFATEIGYSVSEITAPGSTIIYTRNNWQSLADSPDYGITVAVSSSGTGAQAMHSFEPTTWDLDVSAADVDWSSICWASGPDMFVAVAKSGDLNRIMVKKIPNYYENVAPDGWTWVSNGQIRYSATDSTGYVYKIGGDGATNERGCITQKVKVQAGIAYILSANGYTSGVTQGELRVEVVADDYVVRELSWGVEDSDWTPKSAYIIFETIPDNAFVRVKSSGTVNLNGSLFVDAAIFENYADYDINSNGSAIATYGNLATLPDVKISSNATTTSSVVVGSQIVWDSGTEALTSNATVYSKDEKSLVLEITLPDLKSSQQYRFDEVFADLGTTHTGVVAYLKVTLQSSGTSLWEGVEKTLCEWRESQKIPPEYSTRSKLTSLLLDAGETLTIRYYMKTSNATYAAEASSVGYKYSIVTTSMVIGSVAISNTLDPLTVMPLCNSLLPGCSIRLNEDMTGSFEYTDNYVDDSWRSVIFSSTGNITYSETSQTIKFGVSSSIVYLFDTLCPITGVPFIDIHVMSGIPQFSISIDNSTWYPIDSNTLNSVTDTTISRQLDSNANSFHLKGNTFFYLKVEPLTGSTCELGATFLYCDLNTIDIQRIKLYPTGRPQIMEASMSIPANTIITIYARDVNPVV